MRSIFAYENLEKDLEINIESDECSGESAGPQNWGERERVG